jgi:hypothetical protein
VLLLGSTAQGGAPRQRGVVRPVSRSGGHPAPAARVRPYASQRNPSCGRCKGPEGDLAQPALGVRPQHPEAVRAGQRRVVVPGVIHGVAAAGVRSGRRGRRGNVGEAGVEVGVSERAQFVAHRADGAGRAEGGEAPLGVSTVPAQVLRHQGLQRVPLVLGQGALVLEDVTQGLRLVEHPGAHGRDEGVAGDEAHLQGEDAEQQVAVGREPGGGRLGHGLHLVAGRSGATALWPEGDD